MLQTPKAQKESIKVAVHAPAAVTVDTGSLLRDAIKDIRNGTRLMWFIASRALFDVSLILVKTYSTGAS